MITYPMKDAAYAGDIPHDWGGAVGGYLGGSQALNTWSPADWRRFHRNRKLPIWGPGAGDDPYSAAASFLNALKAHGFGPGRAVVIDVETLTAGELLAPMGALLARSGYRPWVYGSLSTVFTNPPLGGYWVGDWTGQAPAIFAAHVRATQWRKGQANDDSAVKWWPWHHWVRR